MYAILFKMRTKSNTRNISKIYGKMDVENKKYTQLTFILNIFIFFITALVLILGSFD
jgi:hypothetical protein